MDGGRVGVICSEVWGAGSAIMGANWGSGVGLSCTFVGICFIYISGFLGVFVSFLVVALFEIK